MCLDYELTKSRADKIKAEAKRRGYIRVWKVCKEKQTGWFMGKIWEKGLRKAICLEEPDGGWYAYLSLSGAKAFTKPYRKGWVFIKVCYAKPQWIKRLGKGISTRVKGDVGIFTHLCFPNWDKGDMTIREFRAMCKGKK